MNADLEILTLGGLTLRLKGAPLSGFHSRKVEALAVYLFYTHRAQARDVLADLLWTEQSQATGNLRVLLTNLRQVLAPYLLITRTEVAVNPDSHFWLDAAAFQRQVNSILKPRNGERAALARTLTPAEASELENALALYRGDFLKGFYIRESPHFEEWVLLEQERLRRLATTALHLLTTYYLAQREFTQGIEKAGQLLEIDPLDEETRRQLMQLLAQNGERHAALAEYEKYKQLLASELHAEPSAETNALRDQIHARSIAPKISVSARTNLPRALTAFIGREQELTELDTFLHDPAVALVTLIGPGGVGKTRLALRAAENAAGQFKDGVTFVALAAVSDPELVLPAIAAALDVTEKADETVARRVQNHLREQEMLLLVDNLEQVVDAAPHLTALLSGCPHLKILATSREHLHVYGEREFHVTPLAYPGPSQLAANASELVAPIARYPSVRLFLERATAVQPTFRLDPTNARAVAEICALVDGLPLAIELAAVRIRELPPPVLLTRLARRLDVLTGGERDRPARHQTLRGTLDWSYDLLNGREKKMFRALATFVGGWTPDAAARVAQEEQLTTLNLLSQLTDKSLIQRVAGEPGEPRFTMFETVCDYALERLQENGERAAREREHALYFLEYARQAEVFLLGPSQVEWLDRTEHELDNIRATLQWAINNQEPELGIELAYKLSRFWTAHDVWAEGRSWLDKLLALPRVLLSDRSRAQGLYTAGLMSNWMADYKATRDYLDNALPLAQAAGDKFLQGQILTLYSNLEQSLANLDEAVEYAQQALDLLQHHGTPYHAAWGLMTYGAAKMMQDDFETARESFETALTQFQKEGDHWACAGGYSLLGLVARFTGDTQQASLYKAEALALLTEVGDQERIGLVHFFLGSPSNEPAERDAELAYFQELVRLRSQDANSHEYASALIGLAGALHRRGDERDAKNLLLQSLSVSLRLERAQITAACLEGLAGIAAAEHQLARATRLFGAVDASARFFAGPFAQVWRGNYASDLAHAHAALDENEFKGLWQEGRALSLQEASAYAMTED